MVSRFDFPPAREDECFCPDGPDIIEDVVRGESACRNCGLLLPTLHFGCIKSIPIEDHPKISPAGFISLDLRRALRLNHAATYAQRRLNRAECHIREFIQQFELPAKIKDRATFLLQKSLTLTPRVGTIQALTRVCVYYAALEAGIPLVISVFETNRISATYLRRIYGHLLTSLHLPPVTTGWLIYLERIARKLTLPGDIIYHARSLLDQILQIDRTPVGNITGLVAAAVFISCRQNELLVSHQRIATAAQISPELVRIAIKRIERMCG